MTLVLHAVARLALPHEHRAAFSRVADALRTDLYSAARTHGESVVVLVTCERFEVYHTERDVHVAARVAAASLRAYGGAVRTDADVVHHLFRVTAGLDSRLAGETHVVGQVRAALGDTAAHGVAHGATAHSLRALFASALRAGRRVRDRSGLGARATTYAEQTVRALRGALDTPLPPATPHGDDAAVRARIAIVGTGALARDVVRALRAAVDARAVRDADLTVVGRHAGRTQALAAMFGVSSMTLDVLHTVPTTFDALVVAVDAAAPIITAETLTVCRVPFIVDLGAAPTVDVPDHLRGTVRVIGLDALGDGALAAATRTHAEALVAHEVARHGHARDHARAHVRDRAMPWAS